MVLQKLQEKAAWRPILEALAEDTGWVDQRRRDYGAAAAWSRRADEVKRILVTAGLL